MIKTLCKTLEQAKTKADTPFRHNEKIIPKTASDEVFGFDGVWPGMLSPSNALMVQASYCSTFKWNLEDKKITEDSIIPFLTGAINTKLSEKLRFYQYKKDPAKLNGHIRALKKMKYLIFHEQLSYQKPKVIPDKGYKSGHYHTRLFLYAWPEQKLLGIKTLKITNAKTVNYSAKRRVEIWNENEDDHEYLEKVIDLGSESQRIKRALEQDLYARSENQILEALNKN